MLSSILNVENIKIDVESTDRDECLAELLEFHVAKNPEIDRSEIMNALMLREEKMSTAIFPGVAVPHCVSNSVKKTSLVIGISKKGVDFENPDKNILTPVKVNVVFEAIFEEEDTDGHLHILRDILQLISHPDFVKEILLAKNSTEVLKYVSALEI